MSIGASAAASKVLGYDDAKCSTDTHNCAMGPLLAETSASFNAAIPAAAAPSNAEDGEKRSDDDDDDDDAGNDDVMLNTSGGKIFVSSRMHHLYIRRCRADDTAHPYHGMSYVVWTRLVRIEKTAPATVSKGPTTDETDDDLSDGESIDDERDAPPPADAKTKGRRPAARHEFVGLPKVGKQQVMLLHAYGSSSCFVLRSSTSCVLFNVPANSVRTNF